jgi:hypothetical protein
MNYQDYIKYDPEKKQYTDSYGYVIDGFSSKVLPSAGEAIAIANTALATATAATNGNFQTVTAGYGLNNQLAITTNNAGTASLTPSGISSNIDVIINPKGGDGCLKVGANFSKSVAIVANNAAKVSTRYSGATSADLTLESKGATGKIVFTNETNFAQRESLDLSVDNGFLTFTSSSAIPATYPDADIRFIPRGIGAVTSTGPIVSSYGYFCAQRTSVKVLGNASNYIDFDTVVTNTFGSSYWTSSNRFTNLSGKTIKVTAQAFAFPTSAPSGGNGESMFELYNYSNTLIGKYGRILYYWPNNSFPNGVSPCGTFIMAPGDYIKFNIYCNGVTWSMHGSAGIPGEYNNLTISQIP